MATAVATPKPASAGQPLPGKVPNTDARINSIVDEISGLTLLQAADLVSALKVCGRFSLSHRPTQCEDTQSRLNIQEVAAPAAAAAAPAPAEVEEAPVEVRVPRLGASISSTCAKHRRSQRRKLYSVSN